MQYKIGDGATLHVGSDCYPATIVNVRGHIYEITKDNSEPDEGFNYFENQVYKYTTNPEGPKIRVKWSDKKNRWVIIGDKYGKISLGNRRKYQDPHF